VYVIMDKNIFNSLLYLSILNLSHIQDNIVKHVLSLSTLRMVWSEPYQYRFVGVKKLK